MFKNDLTNISDWKIDEKGELFHYIDNETSTGYFYNFPHDQIQVQNLCCDMSSSMLTREIDFNNFAFSYASC